MISLTMSNERFAEWLVNQVETRDWSYAELARRAGVSGAMVSLVVNEQKNPGSEFCSGIARALDIPPETVFRKAGLLPSQPDKSERAELALYLFDRLSLAQQQTALTIIRSLLEQEQRSVQELPGMAAEESES